MRRGIAIVAILLTTGLVYGFLQAFAVLSGKHLTAQLLHTVATDITMGVGKPSAILEQVGLDWNKFQEHVPGWIRNELQRMDTTHNTPTVIVVDFCAAVRSQTPPAVTAVDQAIVQTIDDARSLVYKRCPSAVFMRQWRQLGEPGDVGDRTWCLDAYATAADQANDPNAKEPFASILYRGTTPPSLADDVVS